MILPERFPQTPVANLLQAAAYGKVGVDQRLLRAMLDRPDETLNVLDQLALRLDPDRLIDLDDLYLDLYRAFNSPSAIPFYVHRLRESIEDIPDELVEAFAALGPDALDAVIACYEEMDPDDAADVVFLLAAMGVRDARVRAILRRTLKDDPFEGALAIGLLADPELRPDLEAALEALPAGAVDERRNLESALESIDQGVERTLPVFDIFELYPETAPPVFEVLENEELIKYLNCPSSEYRAAAAREIADLTEGSPVVRDALLERGFADESQEVRGEALRALGAWRDDPAVKPRLREAALDQQAPLEVRAGALIALAPAHRDSQLQPVLEAFYENEATRAAALEAMWNSLDPHYRRYFAANLRHEDPEIQLQAIQGVGAVPLPDLALELVPLFDSVNREHALISYAFAVKAPVAPKSVSKLFDRIEEKAGGMSEEESQAVAEALDARLVREGYRPFFFPEEHDGEEHQHDAPAPQPVQTVKVGRNDPCPCGSGKKYKKCCGA